MSKGFIEKKAKQFGEFVYQKFEKDSGSMILVTSMTAIALSCIAQTTAIFLNKKYTPSQKAFMIPQELTEGLLTVASMFLVTKPIQRFSAKLCKTGKLASKEMLEYLKEQNLYTKRGNLDFDFCENVNKTIKNIKNSDTFKKYSKQEKINALMPHENILRTYDIFADSSSAIATTAGGVFTTAFITPVVRNFSASYYQQYNLSIYEKNPNKYRQMQSRIKFYTPLMKKAYGHDSRQLKI